MSKFAFLILMATILALIDLEHQNLEKICISSKGFIEKVEEKVDRIDFFRWLEKRTYGHRNFESNPIRNQMIAAVNPSKESFVEHFKRSSFNVLQNKGIVLSHGHYFDRVVGIYLLEKIIYMEKYKFIAAPEVVIFPFHWKQTEDTGWFVAFGPAFAMEFVRGVCPMFIGPKYVPLPKKTINKEQRAEMRHLLKWHYVDYVHTKNGPNFLFNQKKIVCIDTERRNFPTIDKLGYVHHEKCQRTLLKSDGKRRDDDSKGAHQIFFHKSAGTSPKAVVKFPKINILQRFKILDNGPNIKSIGK